MSQMQERDAMICRSCRNEERASEGYPCADCGTFICIMCVWKGIERCAPCAESWKARAASEPVPATSPIPPHVVEDVTPVQKMVGFEPTGIHWPEH